MESHSGLGISTPYSYEDYALLEGLLDQDTDLDADAERAKPASIHSHIGDDNAGFRMMLKLGWSKGKGLGSGGKGRVDPVPFVPKADHIGVGKDEELNRNHVDSTKTRRALESEVMLNETAEQRHARESRVESVERIKEEIKAVTRAFYCELCDKQYSKISEYEAHLSSYDHNHKKRFKEMQEMSKRGSLPGQSSSSKKRGREDKEREREERDLKRLQEAALAKEKAAKGPPFTVAANDPDADVAACQSAVEAAGKSSSFSHKDSAQVPPVPKAIAQTNTSEPAKVTFGFGLKKQATPIKFSFGAKK
ncbi:hypothetical protein BC830DRAFT_1130853 [Chytriomyces sp. MP71]|nr:hypothetical protein BC830DRAFT_1130853 [Chytriomyces sp. MP71]